ncbi:MAG: GFA family protein [Candidatus Thiodiazotropha sp. 'RUGA']|nr:GFA family protein [Candidatus Thiodiazotropha sp. 'RUGA']
MKTYHGSCHCGRVKFSVTTDIDKVVLCNCSICSKKGVLHHRVSPEQFNLLQGKEYLSLYQFGTKEAKHFFCKECGIHPFSNPRAAPDMYSINVRCLDNFCLEDDTYEVVKFDGKNWEEAVAELNKKLSSANSLS